MVNNTENEIPLVSVIMANYNTPKEYLEAAIDSVLQQTYCNFEFIIVDDGSTNDSISVIESYSDDRIILIKNEKNFGLTRSLNIALSRCNGEYIARMDADDVSLHDRLEKQMAFLEDHPEVDVVGGSIDEIDENGNRRGKIIVYPDTPDACRSFFAKRNPHAHPAVLFRKRFFEKTGCKYRSEYRQNQDTMLWYDGLMAGTQHANIPDVVLRFRMTDSLFKKRRNGWSFAKKQFKDRMMINNGLGYGWKADVYGFAMFCLLISPAWIKKIAYRVLR